MWHFNDNPFTHVVVVVVEVYVKEGVKLHVMNKLMWASSVRRTFLPVPTPWTFETIFISVPRWCVNSSFGTASVSVPSCSLDFIVNSIPVCGPGSVVGIQTGCGLEGPGV